MPRPGFKSYPLQMMLKQKFCHPRDRVGEIRATLPSRHRCKFVEQNLIDRIVGRVAMFPDDAGQVVTDISCLGKVDHHFLWCLYSRKEVAVSPSKDRGRPTDQRLRATSPNAAEAHDVAPSDPPYDIGGVERLCAITARLQEPIADALCDRIAQDGDVVVGDEFGLGVLHQDVCVNGKATPEIYRVFLHVALQKTLAPC